MVSEGLGVRSCLSYSGGRTAGDCSDFPEPSALLVYAEHTPSQPTLKVGQMGLCIKELDVVFDHLWLEIIFIPLIVI